MADFARIFELEQGQMLVYVTQDHTASPILKVVTTINLLQYQYFILFDRWDEAYLALANFTEKDAKDTYAEIAAGIFATSPGEGRIH